MHRALYKSIPMLLGFISLCAIPARGQIVSYMDSSGKRVFINAEPDVVRYRIDPTIHGAAAIRGAPAMVGGSASPGTSTLASLVDPQATVSGTIASPLISPIVRFSPTPVQRDEVQREKIDEMIREVSSRYSVDPALIRSVIQTESNWNSAAVSNKGALGLMQLIPSTAQQMGVANAFDPRQNIDGGVHYLHTLLQRYNGDLDKSLAAYNAGPGAVDRARGVPRYRETQAYVQKVTNSYLRPGSGRLARAFGVPHPIYKATETDGRVVFTNE